MGDRRPLVAELFGTFVLVFVGAGATAMHTAGAMGSAVAHGVALMAVIYMVGGVSGAHVNPAVTFGLAVAGKIEWRRAGRYAGAQLLGALLAAVALRIVLADRSGDLGATTLRDDVSALEGLLLETFLTGFLAFAFLVSGVLGKSGNASGLAVGLVYTMGILVGDGLTGAAMNPARTLGPGIVAGELGDLWVYLVGPCAGAAGGVRLARYLHGES